MNEPLYRIWSIKDNRYLYTEATDIDYYVDLRGQPIYYKYGEFGLLYDCVIQRCTGEQDVNGKYIYEGDIIKYGSIFCGYDKAVIEFGEGQFKLKNLEKSQLENILSTYITVIGNNLENPELLLEKD